MSNLKKLLPNVLIIGGPKCGTSSFANMIAKHPDITLGYEKEPEILSKWHTDSIKKYKEHYKNTHEKIRIDASTSYTKYPFYGNVAQRASLTCPPNTKIIMLYRDPIKRTCSHINYDFWRERINQNTDCEELFSNPKYINLSKYYMQLFPWLEYFDVDDFLIVKFENFIKDPSVTVGEVYKFLSLEKFDTPLIESNKTSNLVDINIIKLIHSSRFLTWLMRTSPRSLKNAIRKLLPNSKMDKFNISDEMITHINSKVQEDNAKFLNLKIERGIKFV